MDSSELRPARYNGDLLDLASQSAHQVKQAITAKQDDDDETLIWLPLNPPLISQLLLVDRLAEGAIEMQACKGALSLAS